MAGKIIHLKSKKKHFRGRAMESLISDLETYVPEDLPILNKYLSSSVSSGYFSGEDRLISPTLSNYDQYQFPEFWTIDHIPDPFVSGSNDAIPKIPTCIYRPCLFENLTCEEDSQPFSMNSEEEFTEIYLEFIERLDALQTSEKNNNAKGTSLDQDLKDRVCNAESLNTAELTKDDMELDILSLSTKYDEVFDSTRSFVFSQQTRSKSQCGNLLNAEAKSLSDKEFLKKKKSSIKKGLQKPVRKQRKIPNRCYHLWDFLRDLLNGAIYENTQFIKWISKEREEFKILNTKELSKLWGHIKQNDATTYPKIARVLRYYCQLNILNRIKGEKLQFKFSSGHMWTAKTIKKENF